MGFGHRAPTHKLSAAQHRSERPGCYPGRFCPATVTAAGAGFSVSRPRPLPAHTPRGNGCQERRRLREREAPGTLLRRRQRQAWARRPPSSGAAASGREPHLGRQPPGPPVASTITSLACGGRGEGASQVAVALSRWLLGGGGEADQWCGERGLSAQHCLSSYSCCVCLLLLLLHTSPHRTESRVTAAQRGQARSLTH